MTGDLVRRGVEVIVARGPVAIRAARGATTTVPIVMSAADDPIADGFVGTLARPGGNVTGIANIVSDLDGKRLDLLREAIPGLARVAVLTNPTMRPARNGELDRRGYTRPRERAGSSQVFEVIRTDDLAEAFAAIARARVGGCWCGPTPRSSSPTGRWSPRSRSGIGCPRCTRGASTRRWAA